MTKANLETYQLARNLIASGIWRVNPEAGTVAGQRGGPFSHMTRLGYVQAKLRHPQTNRRHHVLVHRVVWEHVHGPIEDAELEINHINGDKADNRIENLELVTPGENIRHAHSTGLARPRFGTDNNSALNATQARMVYVLACAGFPYPEIAAQFGTTRAAVTGIRSGKTFAWATGHKQTA